MPPIRNLTQGGIARSLMLFTLPMMAGSLLQQAYNLTDTWIVGQSVLTHWRLWDLPTP